LRALRERLAFHAKNAKSPAKSQRNILQITILPNEKYVETREADQTSDTGNSLANRRRSRAIEAFQPDRYRQS
jgi:hypothetical protein